MTTWTTVRPNGEVHEEPIEISRDIHIKVDKGVYCGHSECLLKRKYNPGYWAQQWDVVMLQMTANVQKATVENCEGGLTEIIRVKTIWPRITKMEKALGQRVLNLVFDSVLSTVAQEMELRVT